MTFEFLFFDGDEAFVSWQGNDNAYGSRHLAKVWEEKGLLQGIKMFMLLDLLGAMKPKISPLDPKAQVKSKAGTRSTAFGAQPKGHCSLGTAIAAPGHFGH